MSEQPYPKSPANIPQDLTRLTSSYQLKAALAIFAILLFFVLYTLMVIGMCYLLYYAVIYEMKYINKLTILLKLGAIGGAAMLLVFTLKFIFKFKNHQPENRIKLSRDKYPELWGFVLKICEETGAPKPKNIYVDPDVNAYVAYSNPWLSLFFPVRKELTIGLGLVSCLNMSEFKAVIAHEFGHFAQRSMKIGSYILSANTIIHGMIFSRDKWDETLDKWRASDIRLSAAAWVITPVIWLIRQMLSLFYQLLNIMYSSLSREMEFNADKVAVSTTGSDAIVSGLWKLDNGSDSWNKTLNHAYVVAQKKMTVKNLYTHNELSIERSAKAQMDLLNSLPVDSRGGRKFFSNSENSKAGMYASHPPNDMREENAKVPYIFCETDERTPWLLFDRKENLQEEMTSLIYTKLWNKASGKTIESEEFEKFIYEENKGAALLLEYHNTFEQRYLQIPEMEVLEREAQAVGQTDISKLEQLKAELFALMQPVREIEELMKKAGAIYEGTTREKSFSFKGKVYYKSDLQEGFKELNNHRESLFNESFKSWDSNFCAYHLALAKKAFIEHQLKDLYNQHITFTNLYKSLMRAKAEIYSELHSLQSRSEVAPVELDNFGRRINEYLDGLNTELNSMASINFVPMPNIENLSELKEAVVEGGEFQKEGGNIFENGGFGRILNCIENAAANCQRIDQKSVGEILTFHKNLHERIHGLN